MLCLHVYLCTTLGALPYGSQKRVLALSGLELQMVVSCCVDPLEDQPVL